MRLVAVHEGKQQLSLRGQATALLAVFGGDEFGGLHDMQTIRAECLSASHANKQTAVRRHTFGLAARRVDPRSCTKVHNVH